MSVFDEIPPDDRRAIEKILWEALDLRLGRDLTRRFAEGVTPEERLENIREFEKVRDKVIELCEEQARGPADLVDVEAVNEALLEWARGGEEGGDRG